MRTLFAAGAALLLPTGAAAQLYQGKVGTAPIVLELDAAQSEPDGRYFYRSARLEIALEGKKQGDALVLTGRSVGDTIALRRAGSGWAGTLTTAKGKRFPVALSPATAPPAPPGAPADLDGYARLQLAGLRFEPGPVERIGGRTIRWHTERISGTRLFRLESGYPAATMARINAALATTQWQHVLNWQGCPALGGGPGIEMDAAQGVYLGDSHVSYYWQSSWSCAGTAHPDFGVEGITYDARTGAPVQLDSLLRFGSTPPPAENSNAWYSYRSGPFAAGLVALLTRYHPQEMAKVEGEDCDYSDPEAWKFPAWYLTPKGLFVSASFPRVIRVCDSPDWAVLPWQALNGSAARRP